ncbi:RNB domain-containing ribonuclease [Hydromonas duriensis]|uniref:Exoribonuclease-2 n=1 Tax=Hydromonas duriensis TaxID=1527608 RepID=A0A4R6YBL1_9BURK|nr:RNB domain-containing ribonuclease [Hydromonas duriensis]TDR32989.1 exoribonuclease-2 [Hydromonas duriensis]
MNYVFYEQSGKMLAAQVMEQKEHHVHAKGNGSSLQKIKLKDVLLQGEVSLASSQHIVEQVEQLVEQADLSFVWECAPEGVFEFGDLARDYFGSGASLIEQAAMWQVLHGAPIYFGKKGRGLFTRQPAEQIEIALAAVAKKEERLRIQAAWTEDLVAGHCPEEILQVRDAILQKKNANDMTYKAVVAAAEQLKLTVPQLLLHAGAFKNAFELHRATFFAEHYPLGVIASLPLPDFSVDDLPLNTELKVFSIDDSMTTEIDDAFSVLELGEGRYRVGVHIAAPSLAVQRDDAADKHAASRMSTMYTPGEKITMLPDAWVGCFSLDAGTIKPVVSIYTTLDLKAETALSEVESKIERIHVGANLRHDVPDMQLTADDLNGEREDYPYASALKVLWQGALKLSAQRDAVRGKPENNNRADFSFVLERADDEGLKGDEVVQISQRMRGSPIDKIVSEWMIFANVNWAQMLDGLNVPALFRTQSNVGVRTSTHAQPHLAMGVPAYMWTTSPLRRYADWFNQMQLLAAIRHGVTAPMQAPFKAKEVDVLQRMSAFDEKYKAYAEQQSKMEKYWCLQWVAQRMHNDIYEGDAIVIKEGVLRLSEIPLYMPCPTLPENIPLQSRVQVRLQSVDWVALTVGVSLLEVPQSEPLPES